MVLNRGRIEQKGLPRELYESPANPFVMSFIGVANQIGNLFIRPHEVVVRHGIHNAAHQAQINRLIYLGSEVRADLTMEDGQSLNATLTIDDAKELALQRGQLVGVDLSRGIRFPPLGASTTEGAGQRLSEHALPVA